MVFVAFIDCSYGRVNTMKHPAGAKNPAFRGLRRPESGVLLYCVRTARRDFDGSGTRIPGSERLTRKLQQLARNTGQSINESLAQ